MTDEVKARSPVLLYIVRAQWRGTAKLLKIRARTMDEAIIKAAKSRQAKQAWDFSVVEVRKPPVRRKKFDWRTLAEPQAR